MPTFIDTTPRYTYDDVFIIPRFSNVATRQDVSTKGFLDLEVPVISANMDTITGPDMVRVMHDAGAIGALHRFMTIEQNVQAFLDADRCGFVSVGVNDDSKKRACALYEVGARKFVIDIAHGHSQNMKDMMGWMRSEFKYGVHIMAGNVTTRTAVRDLESWGANSIKVGVGPGSVCLTKDVTGVTYPIFSAVLECSEFANVPIIADGGIKSYGDIAKALGAGASAVMMGGMFAGCDETPPMVEYVDAKKAISNLDVVPSEGDYERFSTAQSNLIYRGMASTDAMKVIRNEGNLPTAEGKVTKVTVYKGSVGKVVEEMAGALRSAFSYSGARTLEEFHAKVRFGVTHSKLV